MDAVRRRDENYINKEVYMSDTTTVQEWTGGTQSRGWNNLPEYVCKHCGNEREFYCLKDGFSQEVSFRQRTEGSPEILDTKYMPTHRSVTYVICTQCSRLLDKIEPRTIRIGMTTEL